MLMATATMAQVTVGGRVVGEDRAAIVGATVVCDATGQGVATDENGKFAFDCSAEYPFVLTARCLGYDEVQVAVNQKNQAKNNYIVLTQKAENLSDVDVVGQRSTTNFETIDTRAALETVDVAGGIEGVVKTQLGVSSNNELSSQYRVRGGNFDENIIYVNDIEIYRPFLIRAGEQEGLSFVNPDMVESLEFSSGGFNASYGDRMSSVLDVKYKTPQQTSASLRASLMGGSAHFEGKIGRRVSHTNGIRYKTNRYAIASLDTKGDYDPRFFDAQSLWTFRVAERLSVNALGYFGSNRYNFAPEDRETNFGTLADTRTLKIYFEGQEEDKYRTGVVAVGAAFDVDAENRVALSASIYRSAEEEAYDILGEYWLQLSTSATSTDQSEGIGVGGYAQHARNQLYTGIYTVAAKANHALSRHRLQWQLKFQREHFNDYVDEWEYRDSAGYVISPSTAEIAFSHRAKADNELNSNRLQAYVMDDLLFDLDLWRLTINYGVRLQYFSTNSETLVSPRVSMRLGNNKRAYRMSLGRYCQAPLYREMQRTDGTLNEAVVAQKSWQIVLGNDIFFSLSERPFKFTAEAYYKWMNHVNPYSIDNVRIRYSAENNARGYAVGLDAKVNGELADGVESWACFSLMQTMENIAGDGHGWIPRPSDQRVSFSMFFQDHMPNNKSFGATLNLYLSTGLPFGPPNSERYLATNRMPGYKRVDFGLYKDFAIRADGSQKNRLKSLRIAAEVFNLFDFNNTISYFWIEGVDGNQYAVPNYLTSRRINVKFSIEF